MLSINRETGPEQRDDDGSSATETLIALRPELCLLKTRLILLLFYFWLFHLSLVSFCLVDFPAVITSSSIDLGRFIQFFLGGPSNPRRTRGRVLAQLQLNSLSLSVGPFANWRRSIHTQYASLSLPSPSLYSVSLLLTPGRLKRERNLFRIQQLANMPDRKDKALL